MKKVTCPFDYQEFNYDASSIIVDLDLMSYLKSQTGPSLHCSTHLDKEIAFYCVKDNTFFCELC